jgi:hypothetical protein
VRRKGGPGGELGGLNRPGGGVYGPGGELGGPVRAVIFQLYVKEASHRV